MRKTEKPLAKAHARTGHALNTEEAAAYVGLSPSWMAKLRVFGSPIPFRKLGRRVVYLKSDLDAWLEKSRRTSTSEEAA